MFAKGSGGRAWAPPPGDEVGSHEQYGAIAENAFVTVADDPRSTFSIDVDTASYSNMRRFLQDQQLPPADAVRIEELVNYFDYDYAAPEGRDPFSMTHEVSSCPWNDEHLLVHVGLQGKVIDAGEVPARNLVFLLDVSGSMNSPDKLPLLTRGLGMLVDGVRKQDRVAIVVYAGASGVVLEPTSDKAEIRAALERLSAGGSTNGGAGIELAYRLAERNLIEGGINRVILATDGDFNVGTTSQSALVELIERKRASGVFLSVLGFGTGNLKDETMEKLADKGNGNYAYIDSIAEARKVLVEEGGSTLVTIAKDVKIQVEFNPKEVASYRLIGYENRKLAHTDFNDDSKDAGEIGAGHSVTALYEVVPVGSGRSGVDPLKYQDNAPSLSPAADTGELMTVKIRYKQPEGDKSDLLSFAVTSEDRSLDRSSDDFRFAAAVAEFGLILRNSEHRGDASFDEVLTLARKSLGRDGEGHRAEFVRLVELAQRLSRGEFAVARAE
ncbi:MAG: VWA domain-containing protein [Nannocystaceae bacterium]|nr:VWA domain-containing protein [Nannocystaceae bacterium]